MTADSPTPGQRFAAFVTAWAAVLPVMAVLLSSPALSAQPNAATERGRLIFTAGRHVDGTPVRAANADTGVPLPAAFVACENCHGYDARGKTEAGVTVSDIRWDTLTKPYPVPRDDGRSRAPYDQALFFRAITAGLDSQGRPLGTTMPRYQLSRAEAADIAAYLARIDAADDQGVTADTIRLGFAGPPADVISSRPKAAPELLENWADFVNRRGGIFRRQIKWVRIDDAADVARSSVLAVVLSDGASEGIATACARSSVPCLRITARIAAEPRPGEFAFRPSRPTRVLNVLRYAIRHDGVPPGRLAVFVPSTMSPTEIAAVRTAASVAAVATVVPVDASNLDRSAAPFRNAGIQEVVLAGVARDFTSLLKQTAASRWHPRFFLTDGLPQLVAEAHGCDLAGIAWQAPADVSAEAIAEFHSRASIEPAAARPDMAGCLLMANVRLLEAAMDRAGRALNRNRLVESLESLQEVRTGLTPPAGFTPTRHIATAGWYLVPLAQADARPTQEWIPAIPDS